MSLYFDHHATTPVAPEVLAAMEPWWTDQFANPASSSHRAGRQARETVESARAAIADVLGCEPEEVIFTSGATEANNLALKGVMHAARGDAHLVTNAAEHRAVLDPARRLQRQGYGVDVVPVQADGSVDPTAIASAMQPETKLVSVMLANNEVGTINDLGSIGSICRERNVRLHTDAAQALRRIPLDLRNLPVDLWSLTAHKLYGPKGVGALIVRRNRGRIPIEPLFDGGGHERGLRSGTLPVPLMIGFAAAVRLAVRERVHETDRLSRLRDRLWERLQARIPGVTLNGHPTRRLPNNLNVTIPDVDGDALLVRLQQTELAVSSGSACSSANPEPSHVLRAMGLSDAAARASLRFGLGRGNTEADVEHATAIVAEAVAAARTA